MIKSGLLVIQIGNLMNFFMYKLVRFNNDLASFNYKNRNYECCKCLAKRVSLINRPRRPLGWLFSGGLCLLIWGTIEHRKPRGSRKF